MLIGFFLRLKNSGVPVTVKEFLLLLKEWAHGLAIASLEDFYQQARTTLVKKEK